METYIYPYYLVMYSYMNGYTFSGSTPSSYELSKTGGSKFYLPKTACFLSLAQLVEIFNGAKNNLSPNDLVGFFNYLAGVFPISADNTILKEVSNQIVQNKCNN